MQWILRSSSVSHQRAFDSAQNLENIAPANRAKSKKKRGKSATNKLIKKNPF